MNKNASYAPSQRARLKQSAWMAAWIPILMMVGCSYAERGWDVTQTAAKSTWTKTKEVLPWTGERQQSVSFEYQWQHTTGEERARASDNLQRGSASMQDQGYAGRAACVAIGSSQTRLGVGDTGENSRMELQAKDFGIRQAGSLETNRQCSPSVGFIPTRLTLTTDKRLVIGAEVGGRALVEVGGKVYDSAGLYFKFKVNTLDVERKTVSGEFEFISQDQQNPTSRETLFVGRGAFTAPL